MQDKIKEAIFSLPATIRRALEELPEKTLLDIREIRLRAGRPVCISCAGGEFFIDKRGTTLVFSPVVLKASADDLAETFNALCGFSVYSHQREIENGFISLKGGHRAGICGTSVQNRDGTLAFRDISSIVIRVARDIKGAAKDIWNCVFSGGSNSALIVGEPGSGKTTVLRDLLRHLSKHSSAGIKIALIDERGEIAAMTSGVPSYDIGPYCDVFDACDKARGIEIATRCFSPDIIICDEIGSKEETKAMLSALNGGVKFIATAHAGSKNELFERTHLTELVRCGCFEKIVFLESRKNPCKVKEHYTAKELFNENNRTDRGSGSLHIRGIEPINEI